MTLYKLASTALTILLASFFLWVLGYLFPHFVPFLVALVLAVLIEPVVQAMQKVLRLKRKWSAPVIFSLFMITTLGLLYLLVSKVIVELISLVERMPKIIEDITPEFQQKMEGLQNFYLSIPPETTEQITDGIGQLLTWAKTSASAIAGFLFDVAKGLPNFLIVSLIIIISFALISYQLPMLKKQFLSIFADDTQEKVSAILFDLNKAIVGFVRAQMIISFLTYIVALIGLWILGVKYALAISLIIVIVDILPILGTGSVIVPWALYQLLVNGDQFIGIGLLVLYLVIIIFRRIVEPKILGDNIGLSSLAVIVSLYVGFKMFGGLGLFLGPLLFILFKAMRKAGMFQQKIHF